MCVKERECGCLLTFLVVSGVVDGCVGALRHVRAGLRRHVGLRLILLALLVVFRALVWNICDVTLAETYMERLRVAVYLFYFKTKNSAKPHAMNPQRLH